MMKYFFYQSFFLFITVLAYSQNKEVTSDSINIVFDKYINDAQQLSEKNDSITYGDAYKKLKDLYFKTHDSEIYLKYALLLDDFTSKLNVTKKDLVRLMKSESTMHWIKEHIEKTEFKTYDEAVRAYEKVRKADMDQYKANEDYYVYLFHVITIFDSKMFSDVVLEYEETSKNSITYRNYTSKIE